MRRHNGEVTLSNFETAPYSGSGNKFIALNPPLSK